MKNTAKIIIIVAIALGLGGLIGWWMTRDVVPIGTEAVEAPKPAASKDTNAVEEGRPAAEAQAEAAPSPVEEPMDTAMEDESVKTDADGLPVDTSAARWEEKLEKIILCDADENKKADRMVAMMRNLTPDEQNECAQHLVNIVPDDGYTTTAEMLVNPKTAELVSSTIFNDLINRGDGLKLPVILQIAKQDEHPLHGEARDTLQTYLQEDFGTNWVDWDKATAKWLQENGETVPDSLTNALAAPNP